MLLRRDKEGPGLISIAICVDEADIKLIKNIVNNYLDIQMLPYKIHLFSSGEKILSTNKVYDLIFLAVSGAKDILVGKAICRNNKNVKIICITSFRQYLEQAINDMHAFAYLEKPVVKEKLKMQLKDALHIIHDENETTNIVKFKVAELTKDYRVENKIMDFNVQEICYFEYANRKICMKLNNKSYFFNDTMHNLEIKMQRYNFYICHQSFLVNMKYVTDIKGYDICLSNNEKIPLAQKRSVDFRKQLNNFVQKN